MKKGESGSAPENGWNAPRGHSGVVPDFIKEIKVMRNEANTLGIPVSFRYHNGCVIRMWVFPTGITAITVYDKKGERLINWDHLMPQELEWPKALPELKDLFEKALDAIVEESKREKEKSN